MMYPWIGLHKGTLVDHKYIAEGDPTSSLGKGSLDWAASNIIFFLGKLFLPYTKKKSQASFTEKYQLW